MRKLFLGLLLLPAVWMGLSFLVPHIKTSATLPHFHPIYTPKYLPQGYKRLPGTQIQATGSSRLILVTYQNNQQAKLSFSIQENLIPKLECSPSKPKFRPNRSVNGCSDGQTYTWTYENNQYQLFFDTGQISETEALKIANSLGLEILFISI